jgi:hypothetical protein
MNATLTSSKQKTIYPFEAALLSLVLVLTIAGVIICYINKTWFETVYTREDGFVENFTIFPLIIAVFISIRYLVKLWKYKSWVFICCMLFATTFSIFVGGEEISWGQRIFHVQSSAFFKTNNAQQETNLHNLVIDGEKVNKIVFSIMLSVAIAIYMFVIPVLYNKNDKVKKFINWAGIPIPRIVHIVSAVVLFGFCALMHSGKNSEILEMIITSLFLLILIYPENKEAFAV